MSDGWHKVTSPHGDFWYDCILDGFLGSGKGPIASELLNHGWKFHPVVIMTYYEFNKQMMDAYHVGKDGSSEVTIEDLLYREGDT